ncbi:MAG: serine hydrolase domain-containing protein [Pseudomonadota bacterium]
MARPATIEGSWHPALDPLAEAFAALVAAGEERGALCVMREGVPLLDIWGGAAKPGRPWRQNTLACSFSVTKGVLSLLAHLLVDRGMLALETPVAALWPAFAVAGKAKITLGDVLSHRAGLPAVEGPVQPGDLYDWARMIRHLARSAPVVPARTDPVYHNMTYGHLLGEILCRASGLRPLPLLLRRMLTDPLGLAFRIGLDAAAQTACATISQDDPQALFQALATAPDSLFARSMAFFGEGENFNSPAWRSAVIGSGNGHGTARALAGLYGQLVWVQSVLSPAAQRRARTEVARSDGPDPILGIPIRYGLGFELSTPPGLDFGPDPKAPGHWGAGGAQAFADPSTGLAFAYVTGRMASQMGSGPRARALVAALADCNLQNLPDRGRRSL